MRKPYLRLSIFTATVVTVSAEQSPYAVALTTFPNAPEPRVFPAGKTCEDVKSHTLFHPELFSHKFMIHLMFQRHRFPNL